MTVILRYLGKKHGFWPEKLEEELHLEQVICHCYDMLFHFTGIFTVNANITGKPKEYWLKQVEGFNNKAQMGGFHKNLKVLEGYIKANPAKSGFVAGEKLTVGDLMAFCFLSFWYKVWDQEMFVKEFPFLEEYIQKIGAIGPIAEYNQKKRCKHTWLHGPFSVLGHCQLFCSENGHQGIVPSL